MLPRFNRRKCRFEVIADVRHDRHEIDVVIGEQIAIIGVCLADVVFARDFPQTLFPARANGNDIGLRQLLKRIDMMFPKPPKPDDTAANLFHDGEFLCEMMENDDTCNVSNANSITHAVRISKWFITQETQVRREEPL
jgi:hypothetical protein